MDYMVSRLKFSDDEAMQRASDILGAEDALIANICSVETGSVVVRSNDQGLSCKLLEAAGLFPESIVSNLADEDEIQILASVTDAPDFGHDWAEDDLAACFRV